MVLAVLCMALLDATSKQLVTSFPATFVVWTRYCIQSLTLLVLLGPRMGRRLVVTRSFKLQVLRGGLLLLSSIMMVLAFRTMPLADASAINFAAPTIVMVLALVFLHEHVTVPRLVSVAAGMAGVLLIVRPGSSVFHSAAVFPIVAAFAVAMYQVLTRKLAGEDARTMLFYSSAVGAIIMTLFLPWRDVPLTFRWQDLAELAAMGWLATGGHYLFIRALQRAPASGLASITYLQLVFATVIGLLLFGDFPDEWTLTGMLVIAVSGFFLTWYERRQSIVQQAEPPALD
jgi:drug/metabolite transporter (DMT)-like permease